MENIGGIFVVLICGLIVAVVTAVIEFMWTMRHSTETEVTIAERVPLLNLNKLSEKLITLKLKMSVGCIVNTLVNSDMNVINILTIDGLVLLY